MAETKVNTQGLIEEVWMFYPAKGEQSGAMKVFPLK